MISQRLHTSPNPAIKLNLHPSFFVRAASALSHQKQPSRQHKETKAEWHAHIMAPHRLPCCVTARFIHSATATSQFDICEKIDLLGIPLASGCIGIPRPGQHLSPPCSLHHQPPLSRAPRFRLVEHNYKPNEQAVTAGLASAVQANCKRSRRIRRAPSRRRRRVRASLGTRRMWKRYGRTTKRSGILRRS